VTERSTKGYERAVELLQKFDTEDEYFERTRFTVSVAMLSMYGSIVLLTAVILFFAVDPLLGLGVGAGGALLLSPLAKSAHRARARVSLIDGGDKTRQLPEEDGSGGQRTSPCMSTNRQNK